MPSYISNVNMSPYGADEEEIRRKQKLAQMLQQQSLEPLQAPQGGAFASPISPLHVLAKGLQAYKGKQAETEAKTQQEALQQKQQTERQAALSAALRQGMGAEQPAPELGGGPAMPANPAAGMATLAQSTDPRVMQMGMPPLQAMQAQQQAQQQQQFRASESAENRAFREQQAEAARQQQAGMARLTASLRPNPADQQRPPPGYRPTPEGNLQAIPGGPADLKQQGALNIDTSMLNNSVASMVRLGSEANALLNSPGLGKSTGIMSVVPGIGGLASIPGSDAANFKARLETLKSQVGFSVLQEMRNNSKTGGALGQVSDRENQLLQQNLAALDRAQSEREFRSALQRIIKYTEDAKDRFREAYNLKHREAAKSSGGLTQQEQQELDQLRKRFGR